MASKMKMKMIPKVDLNENLIEQFSLKNFYEQKTILIVGATGFVGKVLLAKILEEFPSIKSIYVLIRGKRSKTPQQRLDELFSEKCPIFKPLQHLRDLVHAIPANIASEDLGLSQEDQQLLLDEVQVVFHLAATVNFTHTMKSFFEQNIDATNRLMKLCLKMKKLESIVYVSTAYSNCQHRRIEEKIYPVFNEKNNTKDFQDLESYLKDLRTNYSDLSPGEGHPILRGRPNPYTLSKSITEQLIHERYSQLLPVIICRPSIVISSAYDPIPGWCDSYTGPTTFMISAYTGTFRTWIVDPNARQDMIPVDLVSNSLIIAAAFRGSPSSYTTDKLVINVTADQYSFDWNELEPVCKQYPTMKMRRRIKVDQNKFETFWEKLRFYSIIWLKHKPFFYLMNLIMLILGQRSVSNTLKLAYDAMFVLKPFTTKEWDLPNDNLRYITELLMKEERSKFPTSLNGTNLDEYRKNYVLGVRKFMLKDDWSTLGKARNLQRFLEVLSWIFKFVMYLLLYYLLRFASNILEEPFLEDYGIFLILITIISIHFIPKIVRNLCEPNIV